MSTIKALVQKILEHPLKHEWSLQGLGMLRLYLNDQERLHVWDSRFKVPGVSEMHTHPWDFSSLVVAGEVQNQRSIEVAGEDTHFRQTILCGVGGGLEGGPVRVRLEEQDWEAYSEGDEYTEKAEEIHVSSPLDGTVTIVTRTFGSDPDHAYVYWENGEWVSAEPRRASETEVLQITTYSLRAWF